MGAEEKYPSLFQILTAFAAQADADNFDDAAILRETFAPSPYTQRLARGAADEIEALRKEPRAAKRVITKWSNRRFKGAHDAIAWVDGLIEGIAPPEG